MTWRFHQAASHGLSTSVVQCWWRAAGAPNSWGTATQLFSFTGWWLDLSCASVLSLTDSSSLTWRASSQRQGEQRSVSTWCGHRASLLTCVWQWFLFRWQNAVLDFCRLQYGFLSLSLSVFRRLWYNRRVRQQSQYDPETGDTWMVTLFFF